MLQVNSNTLQFKAICTNFSTVLLILVKIKHDMSAIPVRFFEASIRSEQKERRQYQT